MSQARIHDTEEAAALISETKQRSDKKENFMYRSPELNHANWDTADALHEGPVWTWTRKQDQDELYDLEAYIVMLYKKAFKLLLDIIEQMMGSESAPPYQQSPSQDSLAIHRVAPYKQIGDQGLWTRDLSNQWPN